MRVRAQQDLIKLILAKYEQPDTRLKLDGFYCLRIAFNSEPYMVDNYFGYKLNINGAAFYVAPNGILHFESDKLFQITSITSPVSVDVTLYYEVSFNRESDTTYPEILLDRNYTAEPLPAKCKEIYFSEDDESSLSGNILDGIDNVKGVIIEAAQGCVFKINNNEDILVVIGRCGMLYYFADITSLEYLGYLENLDDNIYTEEPRELKIKYYQEGD